jgi:hypothetical protein
MSRMSSVTRSRSRDRERIAEHGGVGLEPLVVAVADLGEQLVATVEVVGRGADGHLRLGVDGAEGQPPRTLPGQHLDRRVQERRPSGRVLPHPHLLR